MTRASSLARVPPQLRALLAAALLLAVVWSLVTPAWQAPDENSHFGYVQHLGETGDLPGAAGLPVFSTEQEVAAGAGASNANQAAAQISAKMQWSRLAFDRWRAEAGRITDGQRSDGGGPNPASSNPPLYYLVELPAYLLGSVTGASIFTRLELQRLVSLLWLIGTIAGTWLLAGEVFRRDRSLQLLSAGAVALAPMVQFVSATVSPDSALLAVWALTLWLGVRLIKRGPTSRSAAALLAVAGLGCLVKATTYALLPAVAFALAASLVRAGALRRPTVALRPLAAAVLAFLATFGSYVLWTRFTGRVVSAQVSEVTGPVEFNLRESAVYLWQYYLPRLSSQTDFPSIAPTIPVYDILFKGVWGAFGWLEVIYPDELYLTLVGLSVVVLVLAAAGLHRDRRVSDMVVIGFLSLAAIGLMFGLHFTEYRQIKGGAQNFIQGRYLLPLAPLAALALARAVAWAPARAQASVVAAILGSLLVLNLYSMSLVTLRFYA